MGADMKADYGSTPSVDRLIIRCGWLALFLLVLTPDASALQSGPFAGNLLSTPQQQQQPQEEEEEEIKPSRPGVANPAEIPKPGVLQLEFGYDSNFRAEDVRDDHATPLTLRFSAAKRLLLEVNFDGFKSETDELTRERSTGVGDTRVGFQFVALEDNEQHPALAFAYAAISVRISTTLRTSANCSPPSEFAGNAAARSAPKSRTRTNISNLRVVVLFIVFRSRGYEVAESVVD